MTKVMDLPRGWTLWANPDNADPRFLGPYGWRNHMEVALKPEAVELFRAIKRQLDVVDREWHRPGAELRYKALDRAKLAIQLSLQIVGKWEKALLTNDVYERAVA